MFKLIKKVFIALLSFIRSLASVAKACNHAKYISWKNQLCMTRLTVTDLNTYGHNLGLCYYSFMVHLDRYEGICNVLDDLSSKICVLNKTEDVNLNVFNMRTRINKWKTVTKHISMRL